jgi:hypothetical protein
VKNYSRESIALVRNMLVHIFQLYLSSYEYHVALVIHQLLRHVRTEPFKKQEENAHSNLTSCKTVNKHNR